MRHRLLTASVLLAVLAAMGASAQHAPPSGRSLSPGATLETSPASGCLGSEDSLCLSGGRFRVDVTWKTSDGSSGPGHPVQLTSDSGYFWFFDSSNIEIAAKVLNGCGIDDRFWFFATGLTNIEVEITVTDTVTGTVKTYSNPAGTAFQPILDTGAFETCSQGAVTVSARSPEEPLEGVSSVAPVKALSATRSTDLGCSESDTVLCVKGRFQIQATWHTASGATGPAYAAPLTAESGYFWFFDPSNVELIVKTLDACSIEQGNWFFGAGMTDVGVNLTITDTYTGETKTYSNPQGRPFAPVQDTGAFAFCPTPTPTPTPTLTPTPKRYTMPPTPPVPPVPGHTMVIQSSAANSCGPGGYHVSPASLVVHRGDSVRVVIDGDLHFIAAEDGSWSLPSTGSHRFATPGTFKFSCTKGHKACARLPGGGKFGGGGCLCVTGHEAGLVTVLP